jgi:hypothetical protein
MSEQHVTLPPHVVHLRDEMANVSVSFFDLHLCPSLKIRHIIINTMLYFQLHKHKETLLSFAPHCFQLSLAHVSPHSTTHYFYRSPRCAVPPLSLAEHT